tara:strand:- start:4431 stop:4967 length:537 start_codon:yes stop_codon:yes gene_type:complete
MKNLFQGSWQKVLIRVIVLLLVLYVIYRIGKGLFGLFKNKTSKEYKEFVKNELPNVIPNDNSNNSDPDTITDNEAKLIADQLEIAMNGVGTNESTMFNSLQCLNGASLKKVYAEFGQRDYSQIGMMDLFGWFSEELGNVPWASYYNECVTECDGFFNDCMELTYMREIWKRTGMNLTF